MTLDEARRALEAAAAQEPVDPLTQILLAILDELAEIRQMTGGS